MAAPKVGPKVDQNTKHAARNSGVIVRASACPTAPPSSGKRSASPPPARCSDQACASEAIRATSTDPGILWHTNNGRIGELRVLLPVLAGWRCEDPNMDVHCGRVNLNKLNIKSRGWWQDRQELCRSGMTAGRSCAALASMPQRDDNRASYWKLSSSRVAKLQRRQGERTKTTERT